MVSRLIQLIALDRFDLHVRGIEKLPRSGAYILSSNHQSYIDPLILASILPPEVCHKVFAVGTSEIFGKGFMLSPGAFAARRGRGSGREPDSRHARRRLRIAAGTSAHSLSRRRALDRRHSENLQERRGHLVHSHCKCRLCPWRLKDSTKSGRGISRFKDSSRWKIVFGDPILPPPESEASEAAYENLTADLKARVVEMWDRATSEDISARHGETAYFARGCVWS